MQDLGLYLYPLFLLPLFPVCVDEKGISQIRAFPSMTDHISLEQLAKMNPFFLKLIPNWLFYHSNIKQTDAKNSTRSEAVAVNLSMWLFCACNAHSLNFLLM